MIEHNVEQFMKLIPQHTDLKDFASMAESFRTLMTYYRCAIMEVETKFRVLDVQLSLDGENNPIETIKTRLKRPESIAAKVRRRDIPFTLEAIEQNLFDIAGVRVICSFPEDIYRLADCLLRQDDVTLIERKDYIQNPKPNGYRSLHLIIEIPIYLQNTKRMMKVEVQLRTIAMDFWASLEHSLKYKAVREVQGIDASDELKDCSRIIEDVEARMQILAKALEVEE